MTFNVYSIRDRINGFGQLMIDSNDNTAIRNFAFGLQAGIFQFARSDYDLYQIATYDNDSGLINAFPVPKLIISGSSAYDMYK